MYYPRILGIISLSMCFLSLSLFLYLHKYNFAPKKGKETQNRRGTFVALHNGIRNIKVPFPPCSLQILCGLTVLSLFHCKLSPETQSKQGGVMKLLPFIRSYFICDLVYNSIFFNHINIRKLFFFYD